MRNCRHSETNVNEGKSIITLNINTALKIQQCTVITKLRLTQNSAFAACYSQQIYLFQINPQSKYTIWDVKKFDWNYRGADKSLARSGRK